MTATVADVLKQRGVQRLVHFTPLINLISIFQQGEIRPSSVLGTDPESYFAATDSERYDGRPDCVCCTFEYPNAYYQDQASKKPQLVNYPDWVHLILPPELAIREGTVFHPCNASKSSGKYGGTSAEHLERLWSSPSIPGGYSRLATHPHAVPTDLQAEVQVLGTVPLSAVSAIVARTPAKCREFFGTLRGFGLHPERVLWRSAPLFFDRHLLASTVRGGRPVPESVWTPSAEDLT